MSVISPSLNSLPRWQELQDEARRRLQAQQSLGKFIDYIDLGFKPAAHHALLLKDGRASACGPAPAVLADELLSACFGVPVTVSRAGGRWYARATPSW
jgi:iron complex transport system ATP-binding protein